MSTFISAKIVQKNTILSTCIAFHVDFTTNFNAVQRVITTEKKQVPQSMTSLKMPLEIALNNVRNNLGLGVMVGSRFGVVGINNPLRRLSRNVFWNHWIGGARATAWLSR